MAADGPGFDKVARTHPEPVILGDPAGRSAWPVDGDTAHGYQAWAVAGGRQIVRFGQHMTDAATAHPEHPLQYALGSALFGRLTTVYHTENDPEQWLGVRFNRCPTCEQFSPCDIRRGGVPAPPSPTTGRVRVELLTDDGTPVALNGPPVTPDSRPGSASSDEPSGRRRMFLFGWRDGQLGVWESIAGTDHADPGDAALRHVTAAFGLARLSDLAEPYELTLHRPGRPPVRVRLTWQATG